MTGCKSMEGFQENMHHELSEDETLSKQTGPSGEVMDTSGVVEEEFANYSSGCTGYCVPLYIYAALAVLSIDG